MSEIIDPTISIDYIGAQWMIIVSNNQKLIHCSLWDNEEEAKEQVKKYEVHNNSVLCLEHEGKLLSFILEENKNFLGIDGNFQPYLQRCPLCFFFHNIIESCTNNYQILELEYE